LQFDSALPVGRRGTPDDRGRVPATLRRRRLPALCLGLAAAMGCLPSTSAAQSGALEVRVLMAGAGVGGALVLARPVADTLAVHSAETGADGRASFDGLSPARYEVTARHLGLIGEWRSVQVAAGRTTRLELQLRQDAVTLPGVVVEAERRRARFEETAGRTVAEITQRELKLLPAVGEADVLRAIEVLPGVISTSDFSSAFNVRGGSADQNLILLDGLPIFNPFHLGGLFSVFNSDMVASAELMSGGFPAQYGGRVSSVLAVQSDPGTSGTEMHAGISLLAGRAAIGFDLPVVEGLGVRSGRARVSVRRSYFDQLLKPVFDFPYHLTDLQLHSELWLEGGSRVTVSGYSGRDVLDLTGSESFPLRVRWNWGNDVVGAGWTRTLGDALLLDVRGGYSTFSTGIRFPEFDDTEFRSRIQQFLLRADLTARPRSGLTLGTGASLDRMHYDNLAQAGGAEFGGGRSSGWLAGVYAQANWVATPWVIEAGARLDAWLLSAGPSHIVPQPRLAIKRFIGRDHAVKLALGRYSQFLHSLRDEELPLGIDIWVLSSDRAPHVMSDQAQLGLEGYIGEEWFGGLETYVRSFRGVTTLNPADDPNDRSDDLLVGTGLSYGADLHLRREAGVLRPMLAVSWLKASRAFDDMLAAADPPPRLDYAPVFDRRLDIAVVLHASLPRNVEAGLRWSLGTGLPYTRPSGAYVYYEYDLHDGAWRRRGADGDTATSAVALGPRNAERYPTYHRLDLGARRTWVKRWGTITPHVDIVNVYDRRNVLFYFYQFDRTPPVRSGVSMFPFLPTAGIEVRF
jgi:hypothetical protein